MAGAETTVERLRQFLRELSPGARSLLIGELERSVLRGEEPVGADLVLHELRRIVRDQRDSSQNVEGSARVRSNHLSRFSSTIAVTTNIPVAYRVHRLMRCGIG